MRTLTLKARAALCESLGFDPTEVVNDGIHIHMPVKGPPVVTVELIMTDERMFKVAQVLKGFELVEKWEVPEGE